jgi:hypothetical protein
MRQEITALNRCTQRIAVEPTGPWTPIEREAQLERQKKHFLRTVRWTTTNSIGYRWAAMLLAGLLMGSGAFAQQVLYSTFGPDQTYSSSVGAVFGYFLSSSPPGPGPIIVEANAFVVPGGPLSGRYVFTQIDVAIGNLTGTNLFQVQLAADSGGTPGTVLETWTISSISNSLQPQVFTVYDSLHLQLVAGRQYWVTVGIVPVPLAEGEWMQALSAVGVTAETVNGGPWQVGASSPQEAFDVWGKPIGYSPSGWGLGLNQILRFIVAGPVTPPAGAPVEANIGFTDLNGNAIVPATPVTINPGQVVTVNFVVNDFIDQLGQRIEVVPVITPLPNPNASPTGAIQAAVEVDDAILGVGTLFAPVPTYPPDPDAPTLVPQGLAGGQTMQLNLQAHPPNPCIATVSFADSNGNLLSQSQQVNLIPGTGTSVDLNADTLLGPTGATVALKLGQHIIVQPTVTPTAPVTAGPSINSVCQVSVEVFDHLTGRTSTYQTAVAQ